MKLWLLATDTQVDLEVNGVAIFDQVVLSPDLSDLLSLGISISGICLIWPLKMSLLGSFKCQLVSSKLTEFKLIHAERVRV